MPVPTTTVIWPRPSNDAVFDHNDANHVAAKELWIALLGEAATLFTTNYVLVETAVRSFHEDVVPMLQVDWVTEERHRAGMEAVLAAARKKLSLVDCVSFQAMRHAGVRTAFCFDTHFREQGFSMKP